MVQYPLYQATLLLEGELDSSENNKRSYIKCFYAHTWYLSFRKLIECRKNNRRVKRSSREHENLLGLTWK